ncbi:MAG: MFS transporter [Candidatus Thermofonsia Clade 3 bacterium]|uniref:MFS transporter n=1 Tax=Candidatus Thermofonsia Clade 3 bacterium TaxID=2364212 RepID=A0A2M8QF23_9CHLR|nr:MAG: MFS transporter [Candidatus Thermofonsia Clade 3 bacterium]
MSSSHPASLLRVTIGLMLAQSLAQAAYSAAVTVNTLAAVQLSGQKALAGLAGMAVLGGSALAAYPAGRLMARLGRRYGLVFGAATASLGAGLAGFGIVRASFFAFLWGLFVIGMGRAALDQSRFAAAEVTPQERRARAMSLVIWGATTGAVSGPLLAAPAGNWALALGMNTYAGPLLLTAAGYAVVAVVLCVALAVDWQALVNRAAEPATRATPTPPGISRSQQRSFREALRQPAMLAAMVAMACGQAAMVLLMASVSVHMSDHGHDLGDISAVISIHVLGMFALSPLVGQLTDRLGRRTVIVAGAVVLMAGCVIAPLSLDTPWIALGQFFVGLGWSGCYVAGSALLADTLGAAERARLQGANDAIVNVASAAGSLGSGLLLAGAGFTVLAAVGFAVALLPLLGVSFTSSRRAPDALRTH